VLEEFWERSGIALGLPSLEEFGELAGVALGARADEMRDFEPVDEGAENVDGGTALQIFSLGGDEFEGIGRRFGRRVERQIGLRRLEDVVDRGALFARALGEADEIDWLEVPCRSGEDAGGGDVVEGLVDEAEVSEDIADERMLEDGEARDDERNFALG